MRNRAFPVAELAEDAAVLFRGYQLFAFFSLVKRDAPVFRDLLFLPVTAFRTGKHREHMHPLYKYSLFYPQQFLQFFLVEANDNLAVYVRDRHAALA